MPSDSSPTLPRADRGVVAFGAVLVVAAVLAWGNSFNGAFVLDDMPAITENTTIRGFASAFFPPGDGQTVSGRPLVNLSFALNWKIGADDVRSYHGLNLAIHVLAGLALFGVVRRTLLASALRPAWSETLNAQPSTLHSSATPLAFAIAALWLLHPLQTESVTYLSQRAESMAGLWLLLTLYAAIRAIDSSRPRDWQALAFGACLLGMASKEIMYAAPLLVLLHERTFFAGTFRAALRGRPWFYAALASTWLLLGWLVWRTGNRGETAGFGLGISPWHYLLTQCAALILYLRLTFWPTPLVLDYGFAVIKSPSEVWMQALALLALFAITVIGVVRGTRWSFLGAWFFLVLAPSSSVVPVATQTIAEHRMYLALAALAAAVVLGLWRWLGPRSMFAWAPVAIALGLVTADRNSNYHTAAGLWQDTAAKRPSNARAFGELANALLHANRLNEALVAYDHALQMLPNYPKAHHNYGGALDAAGRLDEAAVQFEIAIAQAPDLPEAYYGLGNVRRKQGRTADAIACYLSAIRLRPNYAGAHNNVANLLADAGRIDEAGVHFAAALRADPNMPDAEYNWGNTIARGSRPADAIPHYEAAIRLSPGFVAAHENLGVMLTLSGRVREGIAELEATQRLAPDRESVRTNLAAARARLTP